MLLPTTRVVRGLLCWQENDECSGCSSSSSDACGVERTRHELAAAVLARSLLMSNYNHPEAHPRRTQHSLLQSLLLL